MIKRSRARLPRVEVVSFDVALSAAGAVPQYSCLLHLDIPLGGINDAARDAEEPGSRISWHLCLGPGWLWDGSLGGWCHAGRRRSAWRIAGVRAHRLGHGLRRGRT